MSIILNDQQESSKYDLLKQSLIEDVGYRMHKNHSYSNKKDSYTYRRSQLKSFQEEISDWNQNSSPTNRKTQKKQFPKFMLPQMKNKRKSHNIQDLSRELLKYEQFNIQQMDSNNKFRLSFLKQMTKINFKKSKPKEMSGSPKKINIKLQFPERYQKWKKESQDQTKKLDLDQAINQQQNQVDQEIGSFYPKRPSKGLIPSIKKLVSSSFPKKSMFRCQSERDPYQDRNIFLNKQQWTQVRKSITDQIQNLFQQKQKAQRQRKIRLSRIQRKLPINFLSYSHKKNIIQKQKQRELQQDLSQKKIKRIKSPYLNNLPMNSFYPKIDRMNDSILFQHNRLSQCILLNNKKKD